MKIKMLNSLIYNYASSLENISIGEDSYIPVIYNFYIQKNIKTLLSLKEDIEKCRYQIIKHYGERTENGFAITEENKDKANEELKQLSEIEQEVEIYQIPLHAFKDVKLTTKELNSIFFMIAENDEFAKILLDPNAGAEVINIELKGEKGNEND